MNYINKDELKKVLYSFTPLEEKYRNYYKKNGIIYPFDLSLKDSLTQEKELYLIFASNVTGILNISEVVELSECLFRDVEDVAIAKHPRYNPEFIHRHEFFEIVYVLSGICNQTIYNTKNKESFECKQGDLLIIPPSIPHSVLVKDDYSIILNLIIRKSSFNKAFLHNIPDATLLADFFKSILYSDNQSNYILFQTVDSEIISELILNIYFEYNKAQPYFNSMMNLQIAQLFMYLLCNHSDNLSFSWSSPREMDYIPMIV